MNKKLFGVLLGTLLGLMAALPGSVAADISLTQTYQVILSCSDGHSVILWVDSATLTSLTADVESINTSGTGVSCTLDPTTIDPSTETSEWTVYDYNPSDQAIAPRNSPNSMPATTSSTTTTFSFIPNTFTALLTTTDPSLTGDDSAKTLNDTISVSGDAASFMTQRKGGNCVGNTPAAVRFYFTSPSASGSSFPPPGPPINGLPPAGFYTQFWWSNPVNLPLTSGNQSGFISASMSDPTEWSDFDGQHANSSPAVLEAFIEATQHVQSIGLSFGGECFFETGVIPTQPFTNEQFSSNFTAP
jgi:hypothetical protein